MREFENGGDKYLAEQIIILIRILEKHQKRLKLTDPDRIRLASFCKKFSREALEEASLIVKPDTVLRWYNKLIAQHHDYSHRIKKRGRPKIIKDLENIVIQMAKDNPFWGYRKMANIIKDIFKRGCENTVKNILIRNGLPPSGRRSKNSSWHQFIKRHAKLWATDFFTIDIKHDFLTKGFITYYVLFFIHIKSRKIVLGGITHSPNGNWMKQVGRNVTGFDGELEKASHLIHDGDKKYTTAFDQIFEDTGTKIKKLPFRSPDLNAFAERFVLSIKNECLKQCIFLGEESLRKAIREYIQYYHHERNHQGKNNKILFPYQNKNLPKK